MDKRTAQRLEHILSFAYDKGTNVKETIFDYMDSGINFGYKLLDSARDIVNKHRKPPRVGGTGSNII